MPPTSYDQAQKDLENVLATKYRDPVANAKAYLKVLERTNTAHQIKLFTTIITRHGLIHPKQKIEKRSSLPIYELDAIAIRIGSTILAWIQSVLDANATPEKSAEFLWDKLAVFEGNDRTVALSLLTLIPNRLVPYAQLPESPVLQPAGCYKLTTPQTLDNLGTFIRIVRSSYTLLQKTALLDNLLQQCSSATERIALLDFILSFSLGDSVPTMSIEISLPKNNLLTLSGNN